jgi:hypothetical protein
MELHTGAIKNNVTIFKGQEVWTLEDETDKLSRNVGTEPPLKAA